MSEINLTEDQREAVVNRGGSLLVSAAAGSGKTKVLVERLLRRVQEEQVNVDDFLIITFTRAAAAELRAKIASEITKKVAENPRDTHLRQQLYKIYQADIKTVDAFCVQLLRSNLHLLEQSEEHPLTPDFRVMDEQDAYLLRLRASGLALEEFYEHMDEQRESLAETLGAGRDDRALESLMLELYNKIQSHPYPLVWLKSVGTFWEEIPQTLDKIPYGRLLMQEALQKAEYWIGSLQEEIKRMESVEKLYKAYADKFAVAAETLSRYREAYAEGWNAMAQVTPEFPKLGRFTGDHPEKNRAKMLWDSCKDEMKKIREMLSLSESDAIEDLQKMAPAMCALIRLTESFSNIYEYEKKRRNQIDFADQEHLAIRLLVTPEGDATPLAKQIAEHYVEIMVDEYQDTNEVQNRIFAAISKNQQNIFTVGDLKQSIYRFRLADPTIFREKYQTYVHADEAQIGQSRKVLLSKNFRSRRQVLESTNFIFENIMSDELGDLKYGPDEALNFGATYYNDAVGYETELHILSLSRGEEDEESPDRLQAEARFTADKIAKMLREKFPVQDEEVGMRPCEPRDFTILMRSPSNRMKAFTEALLERGIPCGTQEDDAFFSTIEIAVMFSFLEVIDNPHQDVPLISVLRSPLFSYSPNLLSKIRSENPESDFYEALCAYEGEETEDFKWILRVLREKARDASCDELLWEIYSTLNVMAIFGAMPEGKLRKDHLRTLYTFAQDCAAKGKRSLFDFVTQIQRLIDNDKTPMLSSRQSGGGVQIMSIHKSKGLEFPIVFLCDVQKAFNKEDLRQPVLVHPEMGLGTDCVDRLRGIRFDTIAKTAIAKKLERESKSEEMRLLYVAMTRPKEKLVIVDCRSNFKSMIQKLIAKTSLPVSPEVCASVSKFGDWLLLPLLCTQDTYELRRWAEMEEENQGTSCGAIRVELHENPSFDFDDEQLTDEEEKELHGFKPELLERTYAFEKAEMIPQKVTATQLKGRYLDDEAANGAWLRREPGSFARPHFLDEERALSASERGTAMHKALQYLPMGMNMSDEELVKNIELIQEKRLIGEKEAASLDQRKLLRFYSSDLYRRICSARNLWREYQFSILTDAAILNMGANGEEILLQGVVDLFFEEDDKIVVVDFKTDRITRNEEMARAEEYRVQLEVYASALERIMHKKIKEKIIFFLNTGSACVLEEKINSSVSENTENTVK